MFCFKCGAQNPDDSLFCAHCGSRLIEPAAAQMYQPVPVPQYDPTPAPQSEWTPDPAWVPAQEPQNIPAESVPDTPEQTSLDPYQEPEAQSSPSPYYVPELNAFDPPAQEPPMPYEPVAYAELAPRSTPPAERYVRTEPPKKKKKQRKLRPEPTGGQKALTVLLCVLFSLVFLLASTIGVVRGLIADDTIEEIVENAEINDLEIQTKNGAFSPAEFLLTHLDPQLRPYVTERSLERLLDEEETREFIAEVLEDYSDFLQGENRLRELDSERILNFLLDNPHILLDNAADELRYGDYDGFYVYDYSYDGGRYLDSAIEASMNSAIEFEQLTKAGLHDVFGGNLDLIRFVLSPICYILLIVLCVLLLALIFVVNRANIPACLGKVFATALILGVLLLLVLVMVLLSDLFLPTELLSYTALVTGILAVSYALRGGVLFVGGLVGLIVYKKLCKHAPNDI